MIASLTFDEPTHTYRLLGAVVPSVTQVMRPLVNFDGIAPEVLEAKAKLGRRVHLATQLDDEDDLDEASIGEQVAPYLAAWRQFRADTGAVIEANETMVAEPLLGYAGRIDRVLSFSRRRWLVDIKTSFTTPIAAGPQTAAYLRALGDLGVTERAALRLRPDGTYRLDPLTHPNDWPTFMACLTLYRFKESHA